MKQSHNHPTLGPIETERVARARNNRISVRNGRVRVAYPWFSSRERALQFLETKLDWVLSTLEKQRATAEQRLIRPPFRTRQHELVVLCDPNCTLPSVRITSDKVTVRHHPNSDISDNNIQQITRNVNSVSQ